MSISATVRSPGHGKLAPMAHVAAYAWYQLGMPYAHLFATREGAAMYWALASTAGLVGKLFKLPTLLEYLEFRHRMIEAQLEQLEPDRIIELGAGLSRRGLTWVLDRGVRYIEFDRPPMREAKRGMLDDAPGRVRRALREGELELRSTDILAPSFVAELAELLAGAKRPVVVSEGLLDALDLGARQRLFENLVRAFRAAKTGGHYLTDLQRGDRERRFGPAAAVLRRTLERTTSGKAFMRPFRDLEHVDRVFALAGFHGGTELAPKALADLEPRLHGLRSPTSIWLAHINSQDG